MSNDIAKYYQEKLSLLTDTVREQADDIDMLMEFLVQLLDPDCPPEYRNVIESELKRRGGDNR